MTGRLGDGFPGPISTVKVFQDATLVASASVGANGSFRVEVPAHAMLTLRLVGSGYASVVMPRRSGALDRTFAAAGGEISLGEIRFVGDAATTKYAFRSGPNEDCSHDCHTVCVGDGGGDDTDCEGDGGGATTGGDGTIIRTAPPDDGTHMGDAVPEFDAPSCGGGGGGGGGGTGSGSGSDGIVL